MAITTEIAVKAFQAITRLIEVDNEKSFPIEFGARVKLAQNLNSTKVVFDLYLKQHEKLVRKFGAQVGSSDQIAVTTENMEAFEAENAEILASSSGIKFQTISEEEFKNSNIPIGIIGDLITVGILVK